MEGSSPGEGRGLLPAPCLRGAERGVPPPAELSTSLRRAEFQAGCSFTGKGSEDCSLPADSKTRSSVVAWHKGVPARGHRGSTKVQINKCAAAWEQQQGATLSAFAGEAGAQCQVPKLGCFFGSSPTTLLLLSFKEGKDTEGKKKSLCISESYEIIMRCFPSSLLITRASSHKELVCTKPFINL